MRSSDKTGAAGPVHAATERAGGADIAQAEKTEVTIAFDDNRHASLLFGHYDQNLARLERRLGISAHANGNHVTLKGAPEACEQARRVLEALYARVKKGPS